MSGGPPSAASPLRRWQAVALLGSAFLLWQACGPPRYVAISRPAAPGRDIGSGVRPEEPRPPWRPLPESPNVKESEIPTPRPPVRERPARTPEAPPAAESPSLLAKIEPHTPPRRAASLRLAEEGRRLLGAQQYDRALAKFEQSLALDPTNAYSYFYLAKAHHLMGRYRESLNFLDVAESRLGAEAFWLAEIHALRGDNYRALGFPGRAEGSYTQALRLNPESPGAREGMSRLRGAAR